MQIKPVYNPAFWEEVYSIELKPFKVHIESKCRKLINLDKKLSELMRDPIGNESKIKFNLDKQRELSEDITLSNNLLSAVEALYASYMTTTTKMYEAWQVKEKEYLRQIRIKDSHLQLLNKSFLSERKGGQWTH